MSNCWHTNTYPEKAILICFVGNHCEEVACTVAIDGERVQELTLCTNFHNTWVHLPSQKSREANRDLQIQLDQVLQQAQDPNSKGNSLFAEVTSSAHTRTIRTYKRNCLAIEDSMNKLNKCLKVRIVFLFFTLQLEDKRAEMERQFISMKVQYQSLQKQHAFSKQQLQRMKVLCLKGNIMLQMKMNWIQLCVLLLRVDGWAQVQIATLMQLQGSRADSAQVERLQSMLSEKNGEIQNLVVKLQRLEKVEVRARFNSEKLENENHLDWTASVHKTNEIGFCLCFIVDFKGSICQYYTRKWWWSWWNLLHWPAQNEAG